MVTSIYLYVISLLLIIIWYSLFLGYLENDFFIAIILMIEFIIFFVILIFSFFNNIWIQKCFYKNKMSTYIININIFIIFLNNFNFNYYYFTNLDFINIFNIVIGSDLKILYIGLYLQNIYILLLFVYFLLIIGFLLLIIIKTIKNINNYRIIKYQNNIKQIWKFGGVKIIK